MIFLDTSLRVEIEDGKLEHNTTITIAMHHCFSALRPPCWSVLSDDVGGEGGGVCRTKERSRLDVPEAPRPSQLAQQRSADLPSNELLLQQRRPAGPQRHQRHLQALREGEPGATWPGGSTLLMLTGKLTSRLFFSSSHLSARSASWAEPALGKAPSSRLCSAWPNLRGRSTSTTSSPRRLACMNCVRRCPSSLRFLRFLRALVSPVSSSDAPQQPLKGCRCFQKPLFSAQFNFSLKVQQHQVVTF